MPHSLEVDGGSTPGVAVTIEFPRTPSIPSLMMAVALMLQERLTPTELMPYELPNWPDRDHCQLLLKTQLQEETMPPAQPTITVETLAALGPLPYHSVDISFRSKGFNSTDFMDFSIKFDPLEIQQGLQPFCSNATLDVSSVC